MQHGAFICRVCTACYSAQRNWKGEPSARLQQLNKGSIMITAYIAYLESKTRVDYYGVYITAFFLDIAILGAIVYLLS